MTLTILIDINLLNQFESVPPIHIPLIVNDLSTFMIHDQEPSLNKCIILRKCLHLTNDIYDHWYLCWPLDRLWILMAGNHLTLSLTNKNNWKCVSCTNCMFNLWYSNVIIVSVTRIRLTSRSWGISHQY